MTLDGQPVLSGTLTLAQLPAGLVTNGASGLTVGGTFLGAATTAGNFTGSLAGDVTGTQSATVMTSVGGQTAATVASGVIAANGATNSDAPGAIVRRDATGNFATMNLTLDGSLNLPATTASAGIIYFGGTRFLHAYGYQNFFAGASAGNLSLSGADNTGTGFAALPSLANGSFNTADGNSALYLNNGGSDNTAIGYATLSYNTTANDNTAVGYEALLDSTGNDNTAIGSQALSANQKGTANTAEGFQALDSNTVGDYNTANGYQALYNNVSGLFNTADGYQALLNNSNGSDNAAHGIEALAYNTSGSYNTAEGDEALYSNVTGGNNIALGYRAGHNPTNGNYNIEIGNAGTAADNNTILIGTQGVQTNTAIAGVFGATAASGVPVYVTATGQLGTLTSSARFKQNIRSMADASDVLLALRPVTFQYKAGIDPRGIPQFGLVAEEVDKVDPDLVARDDKNQIYTVRYEAVNAMLLNEFQKEHHQVEEQAAEIKALEQSVTELKRLVQTLPRNMAAAGGGGQP